jgi:hypothetical protein
MGSGVDAKVADDPITAQADYVSLLGLDNGDIDWNYLDADEDAEINLFYYILWRDGMDVPSKCTIVRIVG